MSNQDQIDYWSGPTGNVWASTQDRIDAMMAPITAALLERCATAAGRRVLDIGCGCGTTTLALADRAREICGVDVSAPMLAEARRRTAGRDNVHWQEADASSATFAEPFEFAVSRFGVMFFDDPGAAFAHLRTQLVPNAPLVFVCWAAPADNAWFSLAARALREYLPPPESPPDPKAPGPFAFANPDDVQTYLDAGGFHELSIEPFSCALPLGGSLDQAVEFQSRIGPLSRALKELEEGPREAALAAVRKTLEPWVSDAGVSAPGKVWFVSARA